MPPAIARLVQWDGRDWEGLERERVDIPLKGIKKWAILYRIAHRLPVYSIVDLEINGRIVRIGGGIVHIGL